MILASAPFWQQWMKKSFQVQSLRLLDQGRAPESWFWTNAIANNSG